MRARTRKLVGGLGPLCCFAKTTTKMKSAAEDDTCGASLVESNSLCEDVASGTIASPRRVSSLVATRTSAAILASADYSPASQRRLAFLQEMKDLLQEALLTPNTDKAVSFIESDDEEKKDALETTTSSLFTRNTSVVQDEGNGWTDEAQLELKGLAPNQLAAIKAYIRRERDARKELEEQRAEFDKCQNHMHKLFQAERVATARKFKDLIDYIEDMHQEELTVMALEKKIALKELHQQQQFRQTEERTPRLLYGGRSIDDDDYFCVREDVSLGSHAEALSTIKVLPATDSRSDGARVHPVVTPVQSANPAPAEPSHSSGIVQSIRNLRTRLEDNLGRQERVLEKDVASSLLFECQKLRLSLEQSQDRFALQEQIMHLQEALIERDLEILDLQSHNYQLQEELYKITILTSPKDDGDLNSSTTNPIGQDVDNTIAQGVDIAPNKAVGLGEQPGPPNENISDVESTGSITRLTNAVESPLLDYTTNNSTTSLVRQQQSSETYNETDSNDHVARHQNRLQEFRNLEDDWKSISQRHSTDDPKESTADQHPLHQQLQVLTQENTLLLDTIKKDKLDKLQEQRAIANNFRMMQKALESAETALEEALQDRETMQTTISGLTLQCHQEMEQRKTLEAALLKLDPAKSRIAECASSARRENGILEDTLAPSLSTLQQYTAVEEDEPDEQVTRDGTDAMAITRAQNDRYVTEESEASAKRHLLLEETLQQEAVAENMLSARRYLPPDQRNDDMDDGKHRFQVPEKGIPMDYKEYAMLLETVLDESLARLKEETLRHEFQGKHPKNVFPTRSKVRSDENVNNDESVSTKDPNEEKDEHRRTVETLEMKLNDMIRKNIELCQDRNSLELELKTEKQLVIAKHCYAMRKALDLSEEQVQALMNLEDTQNGSWWASLEEILIQRRASNSAAKGGDDRSCEGADPGNKTTLSSTRTSQGL